MNLSTAIVLAIVVVIAVLAARSVWKSRCNGSCSSCSSCGSHGGHQKKALAAEGGCCSSCSSCGHHDSMCHLEDLERDINAQ